LATKLRKEFIKLLEKDPEFRQTVAGYLGLAETLKNSTNTSKNSGQSDRNSRKHGRT
jgi:hypothetical protein